jgi:hypothetical protein
VNFGAIRTGIAEALETLDLVAVYDTVPDRVVVPSAAVIPGDPFVEYHRTMDGTAGQLTLARFDVVLFAARFDTHSAQDLLDELVGSVPAAIEKDPTLNGAAQVVIVTEATNYGVVTVGDTTYLGCRFDCEVYSR